MCYGQFMRGALLIVAIVACDKPAPTPHRDAAARIVTLAPSATEVVAALGATSLLVGVDAYSTYPPEVATLPKVGSFLQPNIEVIVNLHPTLVVVDDIHGATGRALGDAGIPTVACSFHALPDFKRALETIGERIDHVPQAEAAVAGIDAALDAAAAARPARHPRVLAIIDRAAGGLGNLVAVGPGSWIDELLAVVGGDNVLAASGIRYPQISLEEVLRAQPEVILDLSHSAKSGLAPWQAVDVPAVKNGKVVSMDQPYLAAPSPRVKEALDALAGAIK
jgi:iron complex transport system substrate-binding protein